LLSPAPQPGTVFIMDRIRGPVADDSGLTAC